MDLPLLDMNLWAVLSFHSNSSFTNCRVLQPIFDFNQVFTNVNDVLSGAPERAPWFCQSSRGTASRGHRSRKLTEDQVLACSSIIQDCCSCLRLTVSSPDDRWRGAIRIYFLFSHLLRALVPAFPDAIALRCENFPDKYGIVWALPSISATINIRLCHKQQSVIALS